MRFIINHKWLVILLWILAIAGLFFFAPKMSDLVREKGQITVPDGYSSSLAQDLLAEAKGEGEKGVTTIALVFYGEEPLTEGEIQEVERGIRLLEEKEEELGIKEMITHFHEAELEDQLVGKDGKAILVSLSVEWRDRDPQEVTKLLYEALDGIKVNYDFTSEWMVAQDLITSSQAGVKRTEGLAVMFILIVLLLVFRSLLAPLIPLITVGFTYLVSQSIVSILVDMVDFPISTYTQIFLVAVLFGIGTDYCILLLSRFKEELSLQKTTVDAILKTFRNGGRTVLFSGIAVMIGFAAIGFSQFILFQSAAAVAVGVAVLLIALFTVVPFFMALFGNKLFWPSKKGLEHTDSKLWGKIGNFSRKRPIFSLLFVAVICIPFLLFYDRTLSFDSMVEISDEYGTVKAYKAISESFNPGEALPTTIVIKNDERMDQEEYFMIIEELTSEIEKLEPVSLVRSITRPTGERIEDLLLSNQAKRLEDGLGEGKDGIDQIKDGLKEASSQIAGSAPELEQVGHHLMELVTGTGKLYDGLEEIRKNLRTIEGGIRQGTLGTGELKSGIGKVKAGLEEVIQGQQELLKGYDALQQNLSEISGGYQEIQFGVQKLKAGLDELFTNLFGYLEMKYTDLSSDQLYLQMKNQALLIPDELVKLDQGFHELNGGLSLIANHLKEANIGLAKTLEGQDELSKGLREIKEGITELEKGMFQLGDGQGQIADAFPELLDGLEKMRGGQQQLADGFKDLGTQLEQLTDGLDKGADGLEQVSEGIASVQGYLSELAESETIASIHIPKEIYDNEDFQRVLDTYLSEDRKTLTMNLVFNVNPYSNEAIHQVPEIEETIKRVTKGTKLENATVAIGGATSLNNDLRTISNTDFTRTATIMLIGILFILIFLFRSLIMPLYIIVSLILTYFTTMAINERLFVDLLGYEGITWAVPFFSFVFLIALGVDYSIFLMDRFNEYREMPVKDAIYTAMVKMGTVIISAAIILGGTFAAMMPSGMLSLLMIASITIVGLMLYSILFLPIFIPVMVITFGKANWWPFARPFIE